MSHVTHMNEHNRTYELDVTHILVSHATQVTRHTHMNESCHTHMNASYHTHINESYHTRINESRHTHMHERV